MSPQAMETIFLMGLYLLRNLFMTQKTPKTEKIAYGMEIHICKWFIWWKLNIFKIYKKLYIVTWKKKKLSRIPEYILFQRCTDNQQAHETKLTIVNHQRNVYQNHNEILPHTCQNVLSKRQVTSVLRRW